MTPFRQLASRSPNVFEITLLKTGRPLVMKNVFQATEQHQKEKPIFTFIYVLENGTRPTNIREHIFFGQTHILIVNILVSVDECCS
jgi:hypothetical protein